MLTVITYGRSGCGVAVSVFAQPLIISVRKRVEQSMPDKILFMLVFNVLASRQLPGWDAKIMLFARSLN